MAGNTVPPTALSLTFLSFGLYFGILLLSLCISLSRAMSLPMTTLSVVYLLLASLSANVTWHHIIAWMQSLLQEYRESTGGTVVQWMQRVDIFDAAYVLVSDSIDKWWWSSQHLLFAVSLIIFFWREGVHRAQPYTYSGSTEPLASQATKKRANKSDGITIPPPPSPEHQPFMMWFANTLTFVILGFFGAISTTFALFLIQHNPNQEAYTPKIKGIRPSALLNIMVLASAASIGITPFLKPGTSYFYWNLRLFHLFLLAPIMVVAGRNFTIVLKSPRAPHSTNYEAPESPKGAKPSSISKNVDFKWEFQHLYILVSQASLLSHILLTMAYLTSHKGLYGLRRAILGNSCQTSITADYFFSMAIAMVFMISETYSSTFPCFMAVREKEMSKKLERGKGK
ncbi:hypothetical protein SeMB42_g04481 [Synchytrium endobioticum]|uniref:Uncharacterized protein n=1 Tax=Synchytrium endobioticum TaxID=286115 RepID=A0A507DAT9_9FUNG|nr:hypothetical protein SeMB42_g04481 [Synchytrium endobioticum]TPX48596.1 hypothetical protein SeLEV6574_g01956 [Synchytrium endobioticum]